MKKKYVEVTKELALNACELFELELCDVEFVVENKARFLRIFIYSVDGISMEDCTNVHKFINKEIDDVIIDDIPYTLEVSSFGFHKPFKTKRDYERFMNDTVEVKLYVPLDGNKKFVGKLIGYDGEFVSIEVEGNKFKFELKKVSKVNRVFEVK